MAESNVVVIGVFDGVHKGHQQLLNRAKEIAGGRTIWVTLKTAFISDCKPGTWDSNTSIISIPDGSKSLVFWVVARF